MIPTPATGGHAPSVAGSVIQAVDTVNGGTLSIRIHMIFAGQHYRCAIVFNVLSRSRSMLKKRGYLWVNPVNNFT